MPIVIMKTDCSQIARDWIRPHAVWTGTYKQAVAWCEQKNKHPNNTRTAYEAVKVKIESVEAHK